MSSASTSSILAGVSDGAVRLSELVEDLRTVYVARGIAATEAEASRRAAAVRRLIAEHPRWHGHALDVWEEVVSRTAIKRLARVLDTRALRIRARAVAGLEVYGWLAKYPYAPDPSAPTPREGVRAYLDHVEAHLPAGGFADLVVQWLARFEAEDAPADADAVYARSLNELRSARASLLWFGRGRAAENRDVRLLRRFEKPLVDTADRLERHYPGWKRNLALVRPVLAFKAAGAAAAGRRPTEAAEDPFGVVGKLTIANCIKTGLGPSFAVEIALRASAVVANLPVLSSAVERAFGRYEKTLARAAESRRQRRELLVKVLGAALTPVLGPLSSIVTSAASAALEAGVEMLEGGMGDVGRSLAVTAADLPDQARRAFASMEAAARGELDARAESARDGLDEALNPERVAERIAERALPDGERPSLGDILQRALQDEVQGFLEVLRDRIVFERQALLQALGERGDLDSLGLAKAALWHVHRNHTDAAGARDYPRGDDLAEATFRWVEDFYRRSADEIARRFSLDALEIGCPDGADRLFEWKVWGLHLDQLWRDASTGTQLGAIAKLPSTEEHDRMSDLGFLRWSSSPLYREGVIRFSQYSLGPGAQALAGAFVRYIVDRFDPFDVLTGDATRVRTLTDEKEAVVRRLYDALDRRRRLSQTPSWQTLWADVEPSLPAPAPSRSTARPATPPSTAPARRRAP